MEERDVELRHAITMFTERILALNPGDRLLVYIDQGSDRRLAEAIGDRAMELGARTSVLELGGQHVVSDMARELTRVIEQVNCDVLCELSERYFYQTEAWRVALRLGARIYSLAGLDTESFIRCVGRVDHDAMHRFGMTLEGILKRARDIRVQSLLGTKLTCRMNSNRVSRLITRIRGMRRSYVVAPSGVLDGGNRATFMSGQIAFRGVLESIEGVAVIDAYFWPPPEIGRVSDNFTLEIEEGRITRIRGGPAKVEALDRWFGSDPRQVQHLCIGFNPGAGLAGKLLEAERVCGCLTIGIGAFPVHADGVLQNVTIMVDGRCIEENGQFVDRRLADLVPRLSRRVS